MQKCIKRLAKDNGIYTSYNTPDNIYQSASGGGAKIVDKYSAIERTHSEIASKKKQNQGSAVQLQMKGCPLKLDALMS